MLIDGVNTELQQSSTKLYCGFFVCGFSVNRLMLSVLFAQLTSPDATDQ